MLTHDAAFDRLRWHGQDHLLRFWDELDDPRRARLLEEIEGVDFDLITRLHRELAPAGAGNPPGASDAIAPLSGRAWDSFGLGERAALSNAGMRALREGKAAAFLVAGGQGTRLGFDGPKGACDIGLPSGKSLFQLQAERLLRLERQCGKPIPWYIMTSRENHPQTQSFFAERGSFGLRPEMITFFPQGELPVVDEAGKILLSEKHRLSLGPNGNGGCFRALADHGALEDMRRRGVEWVFVYSVDNALARVCDPRFLGFALASEFPVAAKAVPKAHPGERVGVFCRRNGRPSVLEYSEMSPEMCEARDESGGLLYGAANIAIHLFRRDFLEELAAADLPFHAAYKGIPHVNANGEKVASQTPNAHKFEMFMFDAFPRAPGMAVLEVNRSEEFAPVKNGTDARADTPETARRMVLDLHRDWALAAGYSESELNGLEVEVSPLTSYAGEGLERSSFRRHPSQPLLQA
jgi:UDP-N-acetylglucosamine pyrophosphorylase